MIKKFPYAKNVHIEYFDKIHGAKIKYFALDKVGTFYGIMVDLVKVLLVDHLGWTLLAFPFMNLIFFLFAMKFFICAIQKQKKNPYQWYQLIVQSQQTSISWNFSFFNSFQHLIELEKLSFTLIRFIT